MKKITAMLLCLMMVFALVGCGAEKGGNEITALFDEGYEATITTCDETSWTGVFQKDGSWDTVYMVKAAMTAKQYADLDAIGWDDEQCDEKKAAILGQLTDVVVTDITDKVPSQEELDSYIGMTMGELEDAGFEQTGYMGDPGMGYEFFYNGPAYTLNVTPEDSESIENLDDYSANDLRELKIGAVEFTGFSFNLLEGE